MADLPSHNTSTSTELPVSLTETPQIPVGLHTVILDSGSSDTASQSSNLMTIEQRALDAATQTSFTGHTVIGLADGLDRKLPADFQCASVQVSTQPNWDSMQIPMY